MHFNFDLSAVQILWTLTFAASLVLLVVLLGRDRARRFPWFTASIILTALRLLASRMLYGRLAPLTQSGIFLGLAVLSALVSLLVVIEVARRAFSTASRRSRTLGTLAMLAIGATVLSTWGPWPSWKTLTAESTLSTLRLMQLAALKTDLLAGVLAIELGLLVVLVGRRFGAGFRSHTQQIVIGLSTASMAQIAIRSIWQLIALHVHPSSKAEYEKVLGLQEKLYNASSAVYVAVLIWWIACLWINEPGTEPAAAAESPALAQPQESCSEDSEVK